MAEAAATQDWTDLAAKAQTKLINSIPRDWRIPSSKLPPDAQLDVTTFPKQCGLLSDEELRITESYATEIVGNLAAGEWTAVEVTLAFCKRAAVAHQVVSLLRSTSSNGEVKMALGNWQPKYLTDRALPSCLLDEMLDHHHVR